jgi:hypothetical protein
VTGVADGLGQALDGAVDERPVVERVPTDELLMEGVPRLADEAEVGRSQGRTRVRGRSVRGTQR